MAEWLGQILGQLPGWLIIPIILVAVVVAIEIILTQGGGGLTDIWRRRSGKE